MKPTDLFDAAEEGVSTDVHQVTERSDWRSDHLDLWINRTFERGGAEGTRTPDPLKRSMVFATLANSRPFSAPPRLTLDDAMDLPKGTCRPPLAPTTRTHAGGSARGTHGTSAS